MAYRSNIPLEQRIILGCKANIGDKVSDLAKEYHTNRQFIYTQMANLLGTSKKHFDKKYTLKGLKHNCSKP